MKGTSIVIFGLVCAAGGYAASIFTWDMVRGWFSSVQKEMDRAKARLEKLKAKIK